MSKTTELVFIPSPGMGHLLSTVQVAKLIVQRNEHISVSILIINMSNHSAKVNAYVNSQSHNNPHLTRITFVTLPPLSNPPLDSSTLDSSTTIINLHKPLVKQVVEDRIKNGFPKPAGLVLDMFCTTMVDIANELEIPSYVFFTSGAILLHFIFYTQSLFDDHGLEARDIAMKFSDPQFSELVPGFKYPITSKNVPSIFQDGEFGCVFIVNLARKLRQMKGILVNSYAELESSAIQALQNNGDSRKMPPIYPVGPILELEAGGVLHDMEKESTMKWLDDQHESSVVFLCFGSMGTFSKEQVKEIAHGLDRSGYPFLWALRKPPLEGNVGLSTDNTVFLEALPEGFLDHTVTRGKIIGWAPQIEVLAHSAVGGFVSHCGWNSTLESLWFGVPIGTWPIFAEQQLNAFELVEFELAVDIRMDYKIDRKTGKPNILVTSEEIEQGVMKLMNMDGKIRDNVKEVSNKSRKALADGGSSYHWLGRFIEDVFSNVGLA